MKFTTLTRLKYLEKLLQSVDDEKSKQEALHIIQSIKSDIEENYAEIIKPIRLNKKDSI